MDSGRLKEALSDEGLDHPGMCCQLWKMAEQIEMPFGLWTRVGPRKHMLHGSAQ